VILALCLATLLGWAVALAWFTLSTLDTIRVGLRPDFGLAPLPIALVLVPDVFLLVRGTTV
jgi:hypothetical protein